MSCSIVLVAAAVGLAGFVLVSYSPRLKPGRQERPAVTQHKGMQLPAAGHGDGDGGEAGHGMAGSTSTYWYQLLLRPAAALHPSHTHVDHCCLAGQKRAGITADSMNLDTVKPTDDTHTDRLSTEKWRRVDVIKFSRCHIEYLDTN